MMFRGLKAGYICCMNAIALRLTVIFAAGLLAVPLIAQERFVELMFNGPFDSTYIENYSTRLTVRAYSSVKSEHLWFNDRDIGRRLNYEPNNRTILGIGVNHGLLGVNLGFNFPFINDDDDRFGRTRFVNLTSRVFGRRIVIDGYLQFYKGFYLRNSDRMISGWPDDGSFHIRKDMGSFTVGVTLQYLFNSTRFSYRAAFLETEWQKKSSGSLVAGGDIIYHVTWGDSSLVPDRVIYGEFFNGIPFRKSSFYSVGPNAGYAYTFVWQSHWFVTLAASGTLALGSSKLTGEGNEGEKLKSDISFDLVSNTRIAIGYNSPGWYFGLQYMDIRQVSQAPVSKAEFILTTGSFRISLVKRFLVKHPVAALNP